MKCLIHKFTTNAVVLASTRAAVLVFFVGPCVCSLRGNFHVFFLCLFIVISCYDTRILSSLTINLLGDNGAGLWAFP